jgi:hypothetical protein
MSEEASDNRTTRDPWLTEKEAAKELRVSAYTVRVEREAGRLGYARIRRRVFYPMSEINAYKARALHPAASPSLPPDRPTLDEASIRRAIEAGRRSAQRAREAGKFSENRSRPKKRPR